MQQRQLRLGDILDDYCPRERRVTNHAVVAMVGDDVKQTRCTTCDAEHEYKHAKVPRQRRKADTPAALYAQVAANGPKRVAHEATQHGATARRRWSQVPKRLKSICLMKRRRRTSMSSRTTEMTRTTRMGKRTIPTRAR